MTDSFTKLVKIAVVILSVAIIVIACVSFVGYGRKQVEDTVVNVTQMITIDEARYGNDLAGTLTGNTVRTLIEEYNDGGIYTLTVTKAAPNGFYSSDGIDDPSSAHYLADDAEFEGEVIRNENDVVIAVRFCQVGIAAVDFDLTTAENTNNSVENNLMKAQFNYYEDVQKNKNACLDSLKAYRDYVKAIAGLKDSKYYEIYRETLQENSQTADYSSAIPALEIEIDFYKELSNTINNLWIPNKWFDALLIAQLEDSDNEDDFNWNDDSNDEGSDDSDSDDGSDGWWSGSVGVDKDDSNDDDDEDSLDQGFLGGSSEDSSDGYIPIQTPDLGGG